MQHSICLHNMSWLLLRGNVPRRCIRRTTIASAMTMPHITAEPDYQVVQVGALFNSSVPLTSKYAKEHSTPNLPIARTCHWVPRQSNSLASTQHNVFPGAMLGQPGCSSMFSAPGKVCSRCLVSPTVGFALNLPQSSTVSIDRHVGGGLRG